MAMPRTDYKALPLEELARQYIAGASLRALAALCGARDHKTLGKYLKPYIEAAGGEMRNHAEAQRNRRAMEKLDADDVRNWYDPNLGHIGRF